MAAVLNPPPTVGPAFRALLADGDSRYPAPRSSTLPEPPRSYTPQDPYPRTTLPDTSQPPPESLLPAAARHLAFPGPTANPAFEPVMPLSASPGYSPPVSPTPRAFAQQPTYITPQAPVGLSAPPQEEVCVECAMRDADLASIDVTSPGIWERESDVMFEELLRREVEDEASGISFDESRPRARGGLLSEQNLRVWLSINPREPASRQQTLNAYLKSQRTLLEAEALARARAMQEAKQLDNRMRDNYSQLRRSVYDTGLPIEDTGALRIKPPQSPSSPNHPRSHSREVTLLENGMIVEHIDVRREEREARERRRKEEKRARKSSRSSVIDVNSIISSQSFNPATDSGVGLKPYSRYSQASSARPTSVLTAPLDRSDLPRAYSQASFSDIHSLGSASPRRTRFFGMKNLSAGWRSQDSLAPSGISGSMMDMHVALQNETHFPRRVVSPNLDQSMARRSQLWPSMDQGEQQASEKAKKKKKGLAKIWGIVTGSSKHQNSQPPASITLEDDMPLAPPPPLSYLVRGEGGRHASTPSLPSTTSPKFGVSSSEVVDPRNSNGTNYDDDQFGETIGKSQARSVHPMTSEPDMRRASQSPPPLAMPPPAKKAPRPESVISFRDKSLPPLPMEAFPRPLDARPRTVMSFMPPSGPVHDFMPPQAAFRTVDTRRQSFNGLASRPVIATMPVTGVMTSQYDEYGLSRRSLGRLDNVQEQVAMRNGSTGKRRSRFGLSSLFGKKGSQNKADEGGPQVFPSMRRSGSEAEDMGTSTSRHSTFSIGGGRSKKLELVSQDSQFVAYRYPAQDQDPRLVVQGYAPQ
uniref:Proteophosphoglycan ppg4 n=1 Tax=Mycena chlorophos TaxID=658473 RepID=A0ABQ0LZI0_MYCCL|nr:predicted protein [Mycena chlorophos]